MGLKIYNSLDEEGKVQFKAEIDEKNKNNM